MNVYNPKIIIQETGFFYKLFKLKYKVYLEFAVETETSYIRSSEKRIREIKYFKYDQKDKIKKHLKYIKSLVTGTEIRVLDLTK